MLATSTPTTLSERIARFVEDYASEDVRNQFESRRNHPRYTMSEPVDIMIDSETTPAEVVLATGRDISNGGIGIYANQSIPSGSDMVVCIDDGRDKLFARAVSVHSTQSVGMFKIGARFTT